MSVPAARPAAQEPFNRRTVLWGVFASLLAAAGFFLLSTYAPDFRLGQAGGTSALSKSGVGYAGLARLLELSGDPPDMARNEAALDSSGLMIVTLSLDGDAAALDRILEHRTYLPTLFVLPKWQTIPLQGHEGWEMKFGRLDRSDLNRWLERVAIPKLGTGASKASRIDIVGQSVSVPAELQWIEAPDAVITSGPGEGILVEGRNASHYVLSDPDFLNNAALKDPEKAAAALALVNWLRLNDEPVLFDLTIHGAGRTRDLGKLLIEPPFLALTLTILVAAALAFLHGLTRFGPAQPETRAIPFGKEALVNTTATLLRRAGRLDGLGGRYAALMRGRAAALLGAPQSLQGEELDSWLDSRDRKEKRGFTRRLDAVRKANRQSSLGAARRLHDWIARRLSEHR
jgi:hypothetical protein